MASATLTASPRTGVGKGVARSLRAAGQVPGVIYGHAREAQPVAINTRDLEKLLEHISAESTVVELSLDGRTSRTLIREIQRHPFKRQILHIDFQELVAGEKVTVNVPIVLVGIPESTKTEGGILDQTMRELEIEVDPAHMPNRIEVDVSNLLIGHSIHVSDLNVPPGVEVLDDPEQTVVVMSAPRVEEEPAPVAEAVVEPAPEPELIRKTKEEGEEEQ
jgi:large subunit ribosomal protein L25